MPAACLFKPALEPGEDATEESVNQGNQAVHDQGLVVFRGDLLADFKHFHNGDWGCQGRVLDQADEAVGQRRDGNF